MSSTYAKQIPCSLKSEAAQPSTSFVANEPTTEEPKRTKRRLDRQLSNPVASNPLKEKPRKKNFLSPKTTTTTIKTTKAAENRCRRQQKNKNLTISEAKKLKLLYLKGPAAFDSVRKITNASQLSPKVVKNFCDLNHHLHGLSSMECFLKNILN